MINKMFEDESGTPIRNSLHGALRLQGQSNKSKIKSAQKRYDLGATLDTAQNFKTAETNEDGILQAQK